MPNCKDIVWTKYPFSSQNESKRRPSVLISGKNSYGDVICLPITSSTIENAYSLNSKDIEGKPDMSLLQILTTSSISFEQPMTLDTSLIENTPIATITEEAYKKIKKLFSDMNCS